MKGSTGWVGSVAFSPDGSSLASASSDGTVRLWDAVTGEVKAVLKGHRDIVAAVAFPSSGPSSHRLASASFDGTVKMWDLATGSETRTLSGHRGAVLALVWRRDPDELISAGMDGTVRIWDTASGSERAVLRGHKTWVNALALTADGATLASASSDGTVKLWSISSRSETATLPLGADAGEGRSVAISPDGSRLVAGARYGMVKVWDVASRAELRTLRGHAGDVWSVAFAAGGSVLASGDGDWDRPGEVKLRDVETGRERPSLQHSGEVLCLALSPDGKRLAAGGWDKTILVWRLENP